MRNLVSSLTFKVLSDLRSAFLTPTVRSDEIAEYLATRFARDVAITDSMFGTTVVLTAEDQTMDDNSYLGVLGLYVRAKRMADVLESFDFDSSVMKLVATMLNAMRVSVEHAATRYTEVADLRVWWDS